MKKTLSMILCSAFALTAGVVFGQTCAKDCSPLKWETYTQKLNKDGVFTVPKRRALYSVPFDVDPNKSYTIKATYRTVNAKNNEQSRIYLSFIPRKADGREISCWNASFMPNTYTTVTENAKKGDTILKVKDASQFKPISYGCIVAHAKADFSDLPNPSMLGNAISSKVQKDGYWELTLAKPLKQDAVAGEGIRQHRFGGYLYPAGTKQADGEWKTAQGTVKGIDLQAFWTSKSWPVGTKKAIVAILVNWTNKDVVTELKDITLTVK